MVVVMVIAIVVVIVIVIAIVASHTNCTYCAVYYTSNDQPTSVSNYPRMNILLELLRF